MSGVDITLIDRYNTRWLVHGGRSKRQRPGITIGEGQVDGIYDAPLETEWIDDTDMGAIPVGARYLPRDITLGFHISDELGGSAFGGQLESQFRRVFSAQRDPWDPGFRHARIEAVTDMSGRRWLEVQMREATETDMKVDPVSRKYFNMVYHLRAGMPLWESKKTVEAFEGAGASASGMIEVSNPTDMPMRHTWRLTRAQWTLPDPSWQGPEGKRVPAGEHADRTVPLPQIEVSDGGVVITRERRKLHAKTFTGANFLARMNGNWLRFDIPPYTPRTELPISYTGAPTGGARAELHQPRLWSRPWGMEL